MALPTSGNITMAMVKTELGLSSSTTLSLTDSRVRSLAGKPSGSISLSDLRGKSAAPSVTVTIGGGMNIQYGGGGLYNEAYYSGTFTANVTGGTPTAYRWWVDDLMGMLWTNSTTSSTTLTSPTYNTDGITNQATFTVYCEVTVNGVKFTGSKVDYYTFGNVM